MEFWLFIFGLAIGSFLNVVALRYDPDKFILNKNILGGRSACPKCGHKLKWFELVPLLSFLFLLGRCRKCRKRISFQYPIVELLTGLIFVFVPKFLSLSAISLGNPCLRQGVLCSTLQVSWILVFLTLLVLSLIDFRLKLIPDEASIFLVALGIIIAALTVDQFSSVSGSYLGPYGALFGLRENIWLNRLVAVLFGAIFYFALILITRGRGMGMGDLKLTAALGLVFGWPDIILITALSFIIGSLFSIPLMVARKKGLKSFLPFGPFIALAALAVFSFGERLMSLYFSLFKG